jgi:hypothetical protein
MMRIFAALAALAFIGAPPNAQSAGDDFKREGNPAQRAKKDPLEGKVPPGLSVTSWMNSQPLRLSDLLGKVVVIKFWGVW